MVPTFVLHCGPVVGGVGWMSLSVGIMARSVCTVPVIVSLAYCTEFHGSNMMPRLKNTAGRSDGRSSWRAALWALDVDVDTGPATLDTTSAHGITVPLAWDRSTRQWELSKT